MVSTCTHLGAVMFKFLPLMNWMPGRNLRPTSPKATQCLVSNKLVSWMFLEFANSWCRLALISVFRVIMTVVGGIRQHSSHLLHLGKQEMLAVRY